MVSYAIVKLQNNIKLFLFLFSIGMSKEFSPVMALWFFAMETIFLMLRELLFPFKMLWELKLHFIK